MEPPSLRRHPARTLLAGAAALAACVALAACGSDDGSGAHPPDYARALHGAPAPLAALYKQGNEFLDGGVDALDQRLAALRGHPVVVNAWAAWCGACIEEWSYYQQAVAKFGKRVGFVGVDTADNHSSATSFLADHQVPYPSYVDDDLEGVKSHFQAVGLPITVFYDAAGEVTHTNQGGYASQAALFADIRQYAQ